MSILETKCLLFRGIVSAIKWVLGTTVQRFERVVDESTIDLFFRKKASKKLKKKEITLKVASQN